MYVKYSYKTRVQIGVINPNTINNNSIRMFTRLFYLNNKLVPMSVNSTFQFSTHFKELNTQGTKLK